MKNRPHTSSADWLRDPSDFSFVLGGPLFQFLCRARLSGKDLELLRRRITLIPLLCWLPLLVLAAVGGKLLEGVASVSFLMDVEVHVKFLLAMPLLIGAERFVNRLTRGMVRQFLERGLVPDSATAQFDAAISSAIRWRNSALAETLLLIFVYLVGILVIWRHFMLLDASTWYAVPFEGGARLSAAGIWYGYVSLPVFQFLLLRWYYRLAIWARLLWQVSRIPLRLHASHPDRMGGLGFLTGTPAAFFMLASAHGAILASQLANRILYLGAELPAFKVEILLILAFLACMVFGPLLVFAPQLVRAKWKGKREYGQLGQRYVREFDEKWFHEGAPAGEALVGSSDIQSLADLGTSMDGVKGMQVLPITKTGLAQVALAALIPLAPLALTMMPLGDLLKKLMGILF